MIEIDNKPLPPPILQALQDSLDEVPVKLLMEYCREQPELMKGLSPRPDSAPVLRKRLKALLTAKRVPDPAILDLVREGSLFGQFVVVLSEKAIAHGFPAFCAFLGEPAFLAGLLLDPRETVRTMAWDHLKAHPEADGFKDVDAEQARASLESDFGPFLSRLSTLKARSLVSQKGTDPAEVTEMREKLRRFEEQAKREDRTAEKDKAVLAREREQHRIKLEDFENRLREQKTKTAEAEARAKSAVQALADAQDDLHRRIREGVAAELTSESRRWLLPLREMESTARSHKAIANLLGEVKETIKQQAERDRAMGTRHELHKRLESLRNAREDIREALKNALNRHPRLSELADALDREIESLAALLGEPSVQGSAENAIYARVNLAQSLPDLEAIRLFLEGDAKAFNLFAPGFTLALSRRITDKRHQLLQRLMPAETANQTIPSDRLRHKLALPAVRLLLVVDGHNLLLSRPELFETTADEQPGQQAREELASRLAKALAASHDCDIRLYFDGPTRSETDLTPKLKVIYSGGGQTDQRADDAIVQDLDFYAPRYEGCFIVTDDAELLARATRPGVQGRSLNQLADLLGNP
jgi:hypothetical protein